MQPQAYLHVVEDFEEGEGHASPDDHLVDLVQHVVDQLDLVLHLGPERDKEREKERQRQRERQREKERQRQREKVSGQKPKSICVAHGHCTPLNQDETGHDVEFIVKYCKPF